MSVSSSSVGLSISQTNNLSDDNCALYNSSSGSNGFIFNVVKMVNISSGSQTWYLVAFNVAAATGTNGTFDAIRIG